MSSKTTEFGVIPIPPACRHHPEVRFPVDRPIIAVFALSNMFSAMNLYLCQPLLVELSKEFDVSYQGISRIPTLVQAGCAVGLLFLSPLGHLVPRRLLLLMIVLLSTLLTIGLAVMNSFSAFQLFSFLIGVFSFTPQILVPMTAELVEPQKRPLAILSVFAGVLLGPPLARVLAGAVTHYSSFRNVYWISVGGQYIVLTLLYLYCPDTSEKEKTTNYSEVLRSTIKLAFAEPILIQSSLVSIASSATFSSSWATLTFLLNGPPYNIDTLATGMFGLIGFAGVYSALFVGRHIDKLLPAMVTILSVILIVISQTIQLSFGGTSLITIGIVTACLDMAWHAQQVSLAVTVYGISAEAKSRLHTILLISLCLGQAIGTSVGIKIFTLYGYRGTAALNLVWAAWQFLAFLI